MSWTTPVRTWIAGELVNAAGLNAELRDRQLLLKTSLTDAGKIRALRSEYLADLTGYNLTGIGRLWFASAYTAGKQDFSAGRVVLPVGADKWAT